MRLFVNADGQNILLVQFDVLQLIHSCLWLKLFWSRPPTQIESVSLQLVCVRLSVFHQLMFTTDSAARFSGEWI